MSGLSFPRYGCRVHLLCGNSYHFSLCKMTVVGFAAESSPGTYSRMLYPRLLTLCPASTIRTLLFVKGGVAS